MLAPLLDMMITFDIRKRFTAVQALQFLEGIYASLTPTELAARYPPLLRVPVELYDRWQHLSPEFVQQWSVYRASRQVSNTTKLLRWICEFRTGYSAVQWVRRTLRLFSSITKHAGARLGDV
jgi:hypothetical protein